MEPNRSLPVLKIILYVLAAIVLIAGLIAGIGLIAGSANVQNLLMPLQMMGSDAFANLLTPYLRGAMSWLGLSVLVVSLVLSLLLFAAGRLLGSIATLEARLARLEAQT